MKKIYRFYNLDNGETMWSYGRNYKSDLNTFESRMRVYYMDKRALTPNDASDPDEFAAMSDWISDNLEIETLTDEKELTELLNIRFYYGS